MPTTTITRQQLYDRVWTEPIHRLSKELGISDVGLAKLCRRNQIPIPGRGYWQRKASGHKVKQVPLPPAADGGDPRLTIRGGLPPPPAASSAELHPLIAFERLPEHQVVVPDDVRVAHPLLRSTRQYWAALRHRDPYATAPLPAHFAIQVSPQQRPRALRILQVLLTALEERGHTAAANDKGEAQLVVLDEALTLSVREPSKRVYRELTAEERERRRRGFSVDPYDMVPTGNLTFQLGYSWHTKNWKDGQRDRLEDRPNEIIEGLILAALAQKAERLKREEQERLEQLAAEQRRQEEREQREEQRRIEGFEQLLANWKRHKARQEFVLRLKEAVGPVDSEGELGRWLRWVDGYVEPCDPLQHFRERQETVTVYHATHDSEEIQQDGFPDEADGVLLTERPQDAGFGSVKLKIEVREEVLLPYERTKPGCRRQFRVPAVVLNAKLLRRHN